ncbi:hypothetical protein DL769_001822 [Monosporascus sp. CRB-8-3]|nr:hypothetical protein DL769_001822 [Monosporascus sp. CRB-8-3]
MVLNVHEDDPREWTIQAAIEVDVEEVIRLRQLQLTNSLYPDFVYDTIVFGPGEVEDKAIFTCRWKMVSFYKSAAEEEKGRLHSRKGVGGRSEASLYRPEAPENLTADLDEEESDRNQPNRNRHVPGQQYTHANIFCGAVELRVVQDRQGSGQSSHATWILIQALPIGSAFYI